MSRAAEFAIAGLVAAVVALGVALFFGRGAAPSAKVNNAPAVAAVFLTGSASSCTIQYKTDSVTAAPNQVIMWVITNECPGNPNTSLRVSVMDFSDGDPLETVGQRFVNVPYGDTRFLILKVKSNADEKHYPYKIGLGNPPVAQQDPEIIIEYP